MNWKILLFVAILTGALTAVGFGCQPGSTDATKQTANQEASITQTTPSTTTPSSLKPLPPDGTMSTPSGNFTPPSGNFQPGQNNAQLPASFNGTPPGGPGGPNGAQLPNNVPNTTLK